MMGTNANLLMLVQEALAKNSKLKACLDEIYILANDGAVILGGSAPQYSLKVIAKNIVSSVPGVKSLIDDLRVDEERPPRVGVEIDWGKGNISLV